MDVTTLAKEVAVFLAPFLPYLLKAGEKAAEEAGKKLGSDAWEKAKALWGKMRPKVEARPAAQEAAQEVAAHPRDENAQAVLRLQLKKLLTEDEALAGEVARLWEEAKAAGVTVIARGERFVAISGDVSGVYFQGEAPPHIQGDIVGRDQIKITHETRFHGPVTGPVHTGSGDIDIGSMQVAADALPETLLAALRQAVAVQAPPAVRSKALQRVDWLAEAITESEPDLGLMESALNWFQKHLPSLASAVVAILFSPAVQQTIEAAGAPAVAEFQRRFSGVSGQRRLTDE